MAELNGIYLLDKEIITELDERTLY
jgi:hypothetical protein